MIGRNDAAITFAIAAAFFLSFTAAGQLSKHRLLRRENRANTTAHTSPINRSNSRPLRFQNDVGPLARLAGETTETKKRGACGEKVER